MIQYKKKNLKKKKLNFGAEPEVEVADDSQPTKEEIIILNKKTDKYNFVGLFLFQ